MQTMVANHAKATEEEDFWMVSFSERPDGAFGYLLAQLAKSSSEQDRTLEMDTIYLEINDQAHSGYGLLDGVEIGKDYITFEFDPQRVGLPAEIAPMVIQCRDAKNPFGEVQEMVRLIAIRSNLSLTDLAS